MEYVKQTQYVEEEKQYFCSGISEEAVISGRVFHKGKGVLLIDIDGNEYFDFTSGIFTQSLGHCHPYVVKKMKEQVDSLWNVHDYATPERLDLCKLLKQLCPP